MIFNIYNLFHTFLLICHFCTIYIVRIHKNKIPVRTGLILLTDVDLRYSTSNAGSITIMHLGGCIASLERQRGIMGQMSAG